MKSNIIILHRKVRGTASQKNSENIDFPHTICYIFCRLYPVNVFVEYRIQTHILLQHTDRIKE